MTIFFPKVLKIIEDVFAMSNYVCSINKFSKYLYYFILKKKTSRQNTPGDDTSNQADLHRKFYTKFLFKTVRPAGPLIPEFCLMGGVKFKDQFICRPAMRPWSISFVCQR